MKKPFSNTLLSLMFLFTGILCNAQNQERVDSLKLLLNTDITGREKVDIYTEIATEYHIQDSSKTVFYANRAIALASESDYLEGTIDPLFSIGYINVFKGNFEASEETFRKMEKLSDANSYSKGKAQSLFGLGWLNLYFGKNDIGLEYLLKSLRIADGLGESKLVSSNYGAIGVFYMKKANYRSAMEYFLKGLKINEELNDRSKIASSYTNIGIVLKNQGDYDKAFEYYMKAALIYEDLNKKGHLASNYTNIGILYDLQQNADKALEYQFNALKIRQELGIKKGIAYNYDNIAMVYMRKGSYSEALNYFSDALNILEELNSHADRAFPMIQMGQIYRILNQPDKAKKYLTNGLKLAQETGLLVRVGEAAEQLALLEEELGNYEKAYEAHVLFKEISDSTNNKETIKKIATLSAEYEFQKEKDSLKLLQQQELSLIEEREKQQSNRNLAIALCILLVMITGTVIFITINKTKKTKELDMLRNHISRDLHDEVGTTLSSLALFGTVASSQVENDPDQASKLLDLINSNATSTVESMNDIIWAVNSDEDTLLSLINKMRGFVNEIQDTGVWKINMEHNEELNTKKLDMFQRRNIYLIFKEAVNNAVKYSKGDTIDIVIGLAKNLIKISVKDNGKGFDVEKELLRKNIIGGNGLRNMQKRAEELGGKLQIKSWLNKGTYIQLLFEANTSRWSH